MSSLKANRKTPVSGRHSCRSAGETRLLGAALAKALDAPACVALDGPLGAGKTVFVQGLADGLGCHGEPASPSFAIAHEYHGGKWPLFHFDFYRLRTAEEIEATGLAECLGCGLVAAEWGGRFLEFLPPGTIRAEIAIAPDGTREILIS